MTYSECLAYLEALGLELHGRKFGLEKITALLDALGNPQKSFQSVIVAGTNGKGSTSALLSGILSYSGIRTGLYTSPHLVRVNERIQVDGTDISDEAFAGAISCIREKSEELQAKLRWEEPPSFFEFLTLASFLHFARAEVEIAVLEVGLGGRLDATATAHPVMALITNVDYDHEQILGATLAEIAREKAGVIRPESPVLVGCENSEPLEAIRARARELGAECIELKQFARAENVKSFSGHCRFDLSLNGTYLPNVSLGLRGRFQVENAVAAAAAAWKLREAGSPVSRRALVEALREVQWPGRLEPIGSSPMVLLDGAHNPGAAFQVAQFVRENAPRKKMRLIYASMLDKNIGRISEILFPLAEKVYFTQPHLPRAAPPEFLLESARFRPARYVLAEDPIRALDQALGESNPEDLVLAAGSLFLVGEIRRAYEQRTGNPHGVAAGTGS